MLKKSKGFSLIELIVVIAIIGIIVLLATPKFTGRTQKAKIARIQNDIKIMDSIISETIIDSECEVESFENSQINLNIIAIEDNLYDLKGVTTKIEGDLNEFKVIPKKYKDKIKTKLVGDFYINKRNKIYYSEKNRDDISPSIVKSEIDKKLNEINNKIYKKEFSNIYKLVNETDELINLLTSNNDYIRELKKVTSEIDSLYTIDSSNAPGQKELIAGNMLAGYFGTVKSKDLFTGEELASEINLTKGGRNHNNSLWLKFAIDEKIIFKSMKVFRFSVSWDYLNELGVVDGSKTISKDNNNYKVRLLTGIEDNNEWDRLIVPLHKNSDNPNWNINFTDLDLNTKYIHGNRDTMGSRQWCQEKDGKVARAVRGGDGFDDFRTHTSSLVGSYYGWSPVLEYIE